MTLVLEDTGISNPGIIELCEAAPQQLQHLDLSRTPVTHTILQHLNKLPNLRILNLEQTQVGLFSIIKLGFIAKFELESLKSAQAIFHMRQF